MSDYEMPLAIVNRNPKARKVHKCYECRGAIHPGETYECISGIWPEGPARYRTCPDCARIRAAIASDDWCFGGLLEELANGNHTELLREWVACAQKRGCKLPDWLLKRVAEEAKP